MIKVSDVKKIMGEGFGFVEGDTIKRRGDHVLRADWFRSKLLSRDDDEFIKFAPRPNTGVQPVGDDVVVEVTYLERIPARKLANLVSWEYVQQWKPSMKWLQGQVNKSPYDVGDHCSDASKPIFTKEMADAGELPPVGSVVDVMLVPDHFESLTVICYHKSEVWLENADGSTNILITDHWQVKPIPTEREKAIDEMLALDCEPREGMLSRHDFCGEIFDAGYRKEVK